MPDSVLVIACGALVREITELKNQYGWDHLDLKCIDAKLHMRPALIAPRLKDMIAKYRGTYDEIFVAYADCGSVGEIDKVLAAENVERLPGVHCYQFFAGHDRFAQMSDAEPGTFYLTDFLARHFDQFVTKPLKFEEHPELRELYFGNYTKMTFLSQKHDPELLANAREIAAKLDLEFEHAHVGYGELESGLRVVAERNAHG
ncbi:MAG: DUF1638 domain-containing protein [Pseudomonadota bacterium]